MYRGQAEQDKFVLTVLKEKHNGFFLEIGSNDPIKINNSYTLEKNFDWKGIMVEYENRYLESYKQHRPNSVHKIQDATTIDYKALFLENNVPSVVDYLQIDLEAANGSTLRTLQKLDREVLDDYKFATVTFEHDIWQAKTGGTRNISRDIFKSRGYVCVFPDIHNLEPQYVYEDWYVHPDLVDMTYITDLIEKNRKHYVVNPITDLSISWKDIEY